MLRLWTRGGPYLLYRVTDLIQVPNIASARLLTLGGVTDFGQQCFLGLPKPLVARHICPQVLGPGQDGLLLGPGKS
jgi:hypothetical protein